MNLKNSFKLYGKNSTTNFELEHYAKELKIPNFHCLMRDELSSELLNKKPLNIIINLHTSNQKGVHWSGIFVEGNNSFFFDSYGLDPTKEVIEFLKPIKNKICSTFKLQNETDEYCGILSLYVLYELTNNKNFYNIIFSIKKEIKNV